MIEQLDHLIILVTDLQRATDDWSAEGFNVTPGGEHSDGATHNALIAFGDGTYLELIAFRKPSEHHRWWEDTRHGEGLIDFALLPSDTGEVIAAAHERGLDLAGPTDGGRLRPDGVELRWQTGLPSSPDLPFLCGDVTPRELRVPSGAAHVHPNGAQGITALTVAVNDLKASAAHYTALIGRPADKSFVARDVARQVWVFGTTEIAISAPVDPNGDRARAIVEQLATRGEGAHAFTVRTDQPEARRLDPAHLHGVRVTLVA